MDTIIFEGIIVGFIGASTIGPIAMLIIQRVIERGMKIGVVSGIGVALADGFFGFIGGLGLSVITQFIDRQQIILRSGSVIILVWLGTKIFNSSPTMINTQDQEYDQNMFKVWFSILLLTFSNPVTILYFASVYINLKLDGSGNIIWDASLFGAFVFIGSYAWWVILSGIVSWFRGIINPEGLMKLNKVTGIIIIGFALKIVGELINLI